MKKQFISGKIFAPYLQKQQQKQKIVDLKPNMAIDQQCNNSVDQWQNSCLISMKLTTTTKNCRFETKYGR